MKQIKLLPVLALLLLASVVTSHGQTTAFTYQGRLNVSGSPANGSYDLIFQVFNAVSGGGNIGGLLTTNGVAVSNGLFTVTLDFGGTPFTGPARWLDIAVRTDGAGSYTTLTPRQPLTPTPYAIYANTAGTVTNGAIANAQLAASSVAAGNIQNSTITAGKIASGQVVKSLNGLTDAVSLTQGANVTIITNGNSLQISAPAGGLALPYSGTASSAGSLFTLNNTGAGPAASFFGNVGIGTASPEGTLSLYSPGSDLIFKLEDRRTAVSGDFLSKQAFYDYGGEAAYIGLRHNLYLGSAPRAIAFGLSGSEKMRIDNNGNVGIGTISPGYPLSVQASSLSTDVVEWRNANGQLGRLGWATDNGSGGVVLLQGGTIKVDLRATGNSYFTGGNVGIGTTSPQAPIHVVNANGNYGQLGTSGAGVWGIANGINWVGVYGGNLASPNYGYLGTANEGAYGRNATTGAYGRLGAVIPGEFPYGVGVYGSDGGNAGNYAAQFSGRVQCSGPVNIADLLSVDSVNTDAARFRRNSSDGVVVYFGGATVALAGNVSVSGGTVSYNAFTGSHYAQTDEKIERGALVTLTGTNSYVSTNLDAEMIYGIARSTQPNAPRCLGAYLSVLSPGLAITPSNPHLVMAVGNGDLWVSDSSAGDLQPGDYLISSGVSGCAMKDDAVRFPVGYICARAAEGVKWSELKAGSDGRKRVKISVLFETFVRDSRGAQSASLVQSQQKRLDLLEAQVKSLRAVQDRLAKLEAMLEFNRPLETTQAVAKNGGAK